MKRLITAACLAYLVISAALMLTVRYRADDLEELRMVQTGGPLAVVPYYWTSWSGRWAYAGVAGSLKALPEALAGVYLVIVLAVWAWSVWELGREWGLLTLCVTLIAAPNIAESLFWQSGATVYALPLAIFCLMLVCIKYRAPWFIPTLGAVIIAGLGDTVGVAQIVAIPAIALLFPDYRRAFGSMLAGAVIGFIIVQLAPGNAIRAAYYPKPDFWLALPYAVRATGNVLAQAIGRGAGAIGALVILPLWGAKRINQKVTRQLLIIILSAIALNFILMLAAFYATSGPLPDRARIVPLFATLAAITICVLKYKEGVIFGD